MKRSPGRPLKGNAKRVRVSFTLSPQWENWLKAKSRVWRVSKSEALDRILNQAGKLDELLPRKRLPVPQSALSTLCEKYGVKRLSLFGSFLHGGAAPNSDVDLLADFLPDRPHGMFFLISLQQELSELLGGVKVDLRTSAELSRYFRAAVLKEAEELYAA